MKFLKNFFVKLKRFIIFLLFLAGLSSALVYFSLSEEENFKKSCRDFGLECSKGEMHDSVSSFRTWLDDLRLKVETLEIWKYFDSHEDGSSPEP